MYANENDIKKIIDEFKEKIIDQNKPIKRKFNIESEFLKNKVR